MTQERAQQLLLWQEEPRGAWTDWIVSLLHSQERLRPHASLLRAWLTMLGNSYPEILTGKPQQGRKKRWSLFTPDRPFSDEDPACFSHWPAAGLYDADAGVGVAVELPERPHHIQGSLLIDVIEKGPVSERYFLSPHAARGMLRRADRMKRKLFPPLRQALEILSSSDQGDQNVRE